MPDNLDTEKKSHSHLLRTKKLKFTLTNFCSSLGETETNKQIDAAFSVWQSVCGLSFQKVKLSEDKGNCEIKISFLTDHDAPNTVLTHKTNCPYKLNGQKGRTSAHAFYSGKIQFAKIFTLIPKLGNTRKQFQVIGNTTYVVLLHTN